MDYQKKPVNIKGWEMYQVDTDGNVYGQNGKILKYSINYRDIALSTLIIIIKERVSQFIL